MQKVKRAFKFKLLSTSFLVLLVLLLLSSCSKDMAEGSVPESNEIKSSIQSSQSRQNSGLAAVPFEETLFVPCANGGVGENVTLTGASNLVYQMAWNDHGFNLVYHANAHNVTGVGLSSGETFVGTDGTQGSVMGAWVNNQWIGTTIEQMKIIGRNTRYVVKYKYHLIVTPDGNVTVSASEKTIDCLNQ